MRVIVCGAGQVGWQIARKLALENNEVIVIDNKPNLLQRMTSELDIHGIIGNASYPEVLENAGAFNADMIIAATFSDEVSMVTCQMAHSVFGVRLKVARLRSQSYLDAIYSDIYKHDHMPIDIVISPEREVATQALQQLASSATFDTETFLNGSILLIGLLLEVDCAALNKPLHKLAPLFSTLRATVVGIRRKGALFVPNRTDSIYRGDQIYIITHTDDMNQCLKIFAKKQIKNTRVLIIGAGNIGLQIAKKLETYKPKIHVKVIEIARDIAENAAEILTRTVVLHGDGMDIALLEEANIQSCDAVLVTTNDDKTNLLVAARAKFMGCRLAISLINDPTLSNLMQPLNIDALINPRSTTVSSILRHIRRGRVRAVYSIGDGEAEVMEAEVTASSPIISHSIDEIYWPEGALLGVIYKVKDKKITRPLESTKFEEGDIVVIFTLPSAIIEIERLFPLDNKDNS